jgi:hypothetical protein
MPLPRLFGSLIEPRARDVKKLEALVEKVHRAVTHLQKVDVAGDDGSAAPWRGASSMACARSSAEIFASVSQIGISIAIVTLSLVSINRCRLCRRPE